MQAHLAFALRAAHSASRVALAAACAARTCARAARRAAAAAAARVARCNVPPATTPYAPIGSVPTARFAVDAKLAVVNLEQTRGLLAWAFEMVGERAVAGQLPAACQIVDSAHRCRCVIVDERVVESNVGKPTENVQADDIAKKGSIVVPM